jgi:hypothetical protein
LLYLFEGESQVERIAVCYKLIQHLITLRFGEGAAHFFKPRIEQVRALAVRVSPGSVETIRRA